MAAWLSANECLLLHSPFAIEELLEVLQSGPFEAWTCTFAG